jgi:two-component system sensor histidine kinase KdpD
MAVLGIAAMTALLHPARAQINATTVALVFLLDMLFVAILWGSGPALLAAVLGMVCFNFFFLPPVGALTIADPQNWVALTAFFITAIAVGQLSARAKRRASEAESGRREIERLYHELQDAFERASRAEALRQSEKLKTALLDAVTHDMRTPLTSIKASATMLLNEARGRAAAQPHFPLDEAARQEMLEVIDEESDRLNRFIESLLELARIEAGELHLRHRWGAVDEIIVRACERAQALTRGHAVAVEIEDELPVVRVDPKAVAEVVYTLLDNAAKYSPLGTRISITARRSADEMIRIAVEDEGAGIPAHLRERVFDKFFRATRDGDSSTQHPPGTGMGLAIAKGIVEAHGGAIWIEDTTGGPGARVVFTLPIGDEDAPVEPQPQAALADGAAAEISGQTGGGL